MHATSGWLVAGVALVGVTIGYMSGGSQTPVASAAIPVIFGLAATAIAVLQTKGRRVEQTRTRKLPPLVPDIALYRQELKRSAMAAAAGVQRNIGICLVTFSAGFLIGAHCGAYVRLHDVLRPQPMPSDFAWKTTERPPSVEAALQWLAVQQRMELGGYSANQVGEMYQIQLTEWRMRAELGTRAIELTQTTSKTANATGSPEKGAIDTSKLLESFNRCQEMKGKISPNCFKSFDLNTWNFMIPKNEGGAPFARTDVTPPLDRARSPWSITINPVQ